MQDAPSDPDPALRGADAEVVATLLEGRERFLAFLEKRVGDRGAAAEILQDAFARALERGGALRERESAVAWFYRLLRNAVIDRHRRAAVPSARLEGLDPTHEPAAPDEETSAAICRCVLALADTLQPGYAAALRRVEVDGLALRDFAAEAGITPGNAAVRVHRAREALRSRLAAACRACAEHGCLDCTCSPAG